MLLLSCSADESLYHYIEIRIPQGEAVVEVAFSVHAADLDLARAYGADPSNQKLEWLRDRNDEEIGALLAEARTFIAASFGLSMGEGVIESYADSLRFPSSSVLRDRPDSIDGARPGSIVGILALSRTGTDLKLAFSKTAGKRLLVVLNRPASFPLVRDLAPGDSAVFSLASLQP